jgi:heme/copper-type cytochrome/quinol oxidase subunit 4
MPLQDELLYRRRNALLVFYLAALLSACAVGFAGKIPSSRTPFFALVIGSPGVAVVFLLRFLRANDEREQQIDYQALTFAFTGTLIFLWQSVFYKASDSTPFPGLATRF